LINGARALRLGAGVVADPPVVLAPMAGITNTAFRRLCREQMSGALAPGRAGGLFVSEMITTRALVERNTKTLRLIRFETDETPRSIQLYGVDPAVVGAARRRPPGRGPRRLRRRRPRGP
jgi:tRNA-dihydrouridine synthase